MPEKKTMQRARRAKREGKAPTTQAGEFVREEIEHVRKGKHGARSPQQAIAIGLSKARRSGVQLPPPKKGKTTERTRRQAQRDLAKGRAEGEMDTAKRPRRKKSARRSRAVSGALKRENRRSASRQALAKQARSAAARRRRRGTVTEGAGGKRAGTRRRPRTTQRRRSKTRTRASR